MNVPYPRHLFAPDRTAFPHGCSPGQNRSPAPFGLSAPGARSAGDIILYAVFPHVDCDESLDLTQSRGFCFYATHPQLLGVLTAPPPLKSVILSLGSRSLHATAFL